MAHFVISLRLLFGRAFEPMDMESRESIVNIICAMGDVTWGL